MLASSVASWKGRWLLPVGWVVSRQCWGGLAREKHTVMGQVTGPLKMSPMQLGLSEREQGVGPLLGPVTDLKMTAL